MYCRLSCIHSQTSSMVVIKFTVHYTVHSHSISSPFESIEWFIEDQVISPSHDLAPRPPPPSVSDTQEDWERDTSCWRKAEREWARSRIIRPQESLVFRKSFNNLCSPPFSFHQLITGLFYDDLLSSCPLPPVGGAFSLAGLHSSIYVSQQLGQCQAFKFPAKYTKSWDFPRFFTFNFLISSFW
jgi:hypothetical protein